MIGKRVRFEDETWQALELLARDRMMDFQELADEAFDDLLRKHGRPADLKVALRQSAKQPDRQSAKGPDRERASAAAMPRSRTRKPRT